MLRTSIAFSLLLTLASAPAAAQIASRPTRASLDRGFSFARVGLAKCIGTTHGTLAVEVTLAPNGHTASVRIRGGSLASPVRARCFETALRVVHVPPFHGAAYTAAFRYSLP